MIILKIPQTIFGVNNVIVCHLFKDRQYTFFIKFEVLLDLISVQLFFQCTIFLIISIYWMDVVFFYLLGSRHSFINSLSEREFLSGGFLMVLWTMFYRDNNMLSLFSIVFHWEQWLYIYIYIRLKVKPNSVRIRSMRWQIFVLPSTGFELTPLIQCSTNRLVLCTAP